MIRVELAALGQLRGESTQTDSNSDVIAIPVERTGTATSAREVLLGFATLALRAG